MTFCFFMDKYILKQNTQNFREASNKVTVSKFFLLFSTLLNQTWMYKAERRFDLKSRPIELIINPVNNRYYKTIKKSYNCIKCTCNRIDLTDSIGVAREGKKNHGSFPNFQSLGSEFDSNAENMFCSLLEICMISNKVFKEIDKLKLIFG